MADLVVDKGVKHQSPRSPQQGSIKNIHTQLEQVRHGLNTIQEASSPFNALASIDGRQSGGCSLSADQRRELEELRAHKHSGTAKIEALEQQVATLHASKMEDKALIDAQQKQLQQLDGGNDELAAALKRIQELDTQLQQNKDEYEAALAKQKEMIQSGLWMIPIEVRIVLWADRAEVIPRMRN